MIKATIRNGNRGFSFIDALAACFLLTGGLVVVAGALQGLSAADSAASAKVNAKALAVSVMSELKGLSFEQALQYAYAPDSIAPGEVHIELIDTAGTAVTLPSQGLDAKAFPRNTKTHVKASCRSTQGHVVTVEAVGFLMRQESQP